MPVTRALFEKQKLRAAWTDPQALATTLLLLFVDTYGTEGFTWHHETIKGEIEDDFDIVMPQGNFDRLMVAIHLLTTDDFYTSAADFVTWCNILSGDSVGTSWDDADASEVAWGITEAIIIEPPEEEEPFSEEIRAYIGAVLDREGIMTPPDVLKLGLRDVEDLVSTVQGEFSDDPLMFAAIYEFEGDKTEAVNQYIRHQLRLLSKQLEALPIRSGSTRGVINRVLRALQGSEASREQ
jgi:hypothetical protein